MQKIAPFLWFDSQAEEAAKFYCSIFKGKIIGKSKYGKGAPMPEGTVMGVTFKIQGLEIQALNAGPVFKFNPAISMFVHCKNQREVDTYWKKLLSGGGKASRCGWLEDKYGLSWQVIPEQLGQMLGAKDRKKAAAAMQSMMGMVKIDIKAMKKAYDAA